MTKEQKYHIRYYEEHGDEIRERAREYGRAHREERVAYVREWRRRNPESVKYHNKKYRAAHKDQIRASQKAYYQAHREKALAYAREYYRKKKEAMKDEL